MNDSCTHSDTQGRDQTPSTAPLWEARMNDSLSNDVWFKRGATWASGQGKKVRTAKRGV